MKKALLLCGIVALLAPVPALTADDLNLTSSEMSSALLSQHGTTFSVEAYRSRGAGNGFVCMWADRVASEAGGARVRIFEHSCFEEEGSAQVVVDELNWSATARASGRSSVWETTETYDAASGEWVPTAVAEREGSASAELVWRGVGEAKLEPRAGAGVCYSLFVVCGGASARVTKGALVSGTANFSTVPASVRYEDHAGQISLR